VIEGDDAGIDLGAGELAHHPDPVFALRGAGIIVE
jgi:hypothetical protein